MSAANRPTIAYVAFGSNRGRRRFTVERALGMLSRVPGVRLLRVSPLHRTAPVGGPPQGSFVNGVAAVSVRGLSARAFLGRLLEIERSLGRRRSVRWGPREIDLDLITFGAALARGRRLTLPHPRYHERAFVLVPLANVAPRHKHRRLGLTPAALLRRLPPAGQRVTMVAEWKESRFRPFSRRKRRASQSSR